MEMKTTSRASKHGFSDYTRRELGFIRPISFVHRIYASQPIVKRIGLYGKLEGHEGCVNAIEFNFSGDRLVSGSDDREVKFWNWATKTLLFSYSSGHIDNIFQTRIMPFTEDRKIVTSAGDGQIRLGEMLENGCVETKRLGKHRGRVHNLAVEPGSPHSFYSCGEDGFVQHFDLRSNSATKLFCCSSFMENNQQPLGNIRLNAIVINPRNPNYFALGGSDEYARVYDIRRYQLAASNNVDQPVDTFCPSHLMKTHLVHITALSYSRTNELLVSYIDELIYLFNKNMGLGPNPFSVPNEELQRLEKPEMYSGHRNAQTIKGVNFLGPSDEYVMSGSDCGRIYIWKKKGAELVRVMVGDRHVVNQLEPHPCIPVIATCGIDKTVKLWAPSPKEFPPLPHDVEELLESNRQSREHNSRVTLSPDVIMHVLRLHRRQALAYIERTYARANDESDDEDVEALFGFHGGDASMDHGATGESTDCNIS